MAKPVHKDSNDCSSSSLDLFLLPPTQSSFQKGKTIDYHPITSLSDGGPIEFKVSGSGKEFLDLARSYLYLKVKVSKTDGSNLDGTSKVGFANYPIASLFNQVDVILGGKLISSATNTYAHRSILEVLLNNDKEAAESQLGCGLFCKDTAGQMEEMDISADPVLNTGLGTRSEWTKTSKTVELQGRIHSDLFNQEKLILNGVDLTVKLHRHKPEFCLLSADIAPAYKIIIVDAILYVKKIELTPSVFNAINTVLNDKNAQYAITRTTPKVFTVPRGQQSQHIDNAFLGEIPKRLAVCMMDNDSYNGNYKKNPFNFKHYDLTQIGISVNGEEVPFKPLKLNFDEKLFVTAYNTLFSGTGKLHGNSGSIIKREDYSEGYTIIVADLTPFEIGDNFDLKAEGTLSIDLVFKSPLAATINVLVYAEYDNVIEIDSNRNVIKDWSN